MAKFFFSLVMFIISVLVGLFTAYVVFDVSKLFEIDVITSLGYVKIYVIIQLISLIFYKTGELEERTYEEKMSDIMTKLMERVLLNSFVWGMMYLMFHIM